MAITAHLVVGGAKKAIEFYKNAFGAMEVVRMPAEDGERLMHAHLRIGDAELMLADDFPEYHGGKSHDPLKLGATPVTLHQYVPDADAAIAKGGQGRGDGDDAGPGHVLGRPLRPGPRPVRAHVVVRAQAGEVKKAGRVAEVARLRVRRPPRA